MKYRQQALQGYSHMYFSVLSICVDLQEKYPTLFLPSGNLLTRRRQNIQLTYPLGPISSFEKWVRLGFTSFLPGSALPLEGWLSNSLRAHGPPGLVNMRVPAQEACPRLKFCTSNRLPDAGFEYSGPGGGSELPQRQGDAPGTAGWGLGRLVMILSADVHQWIVTCQTQCTVQINQ